MDAAEESEEFSVRKMVRLRGDTAARAEYWADRIGRENGSKFSFNAFVATAVENEVARRNGVMVDADNIVTGRLNQMADAVTALSHQVEAMRALIDAQYASLMRLSQGDSILTDDPTLLSGEYEEA